MSEQTKLLVISDIHGKHELIQSAIDEFIHHDYNKLVFLGDYADSFDRSNEDILRCFRLIIDAKEEMGDDVILLLGNHDVQYLYEDNSEITCKGYRPNIYASLHHYLKSYKTHFQYAYSIGNYLFTHAGVTSAWYLKHYNTLDKWCNILNLDTGDDNFLGHLLNAIGNSHDAHILHDVGEIRGGRGVGGPLWADKSEMLKGPMPGVDHVVGHTPVKFITKHTLFGGRHVTNTSVTFTDVLNTNEKFFKLKINA